MAHVLGDGLTRYSLHLHPPGLDPSFSESLLGDNAADVVGEDEGGLQDGYRLGMRVGRWFVDGDVQGSAVILHPRHLHVL